MLPVFDLVPGTSPLLISIPHAGTKLSPGLVERLTLAAQALPDTDWHVPELYDFAHGLGASFVIARYARTVIDLNRPPDGQSLYPGQATTDLCPITLFDGQPLYRPNQAPDADEIAARRTQYWQPYHDSLRAELDRIKAAHGYALLYDAHSIQSAVPRLFSGSLPDLNIGTVNGTSCGSRVGEALLATAQKDAAFSSVLNGRFIGGYITRHYGRPTEGIDALQMELAQKTYMSERSPFTYEPHKAKRLQKILRQILETFLTHAHNRSVK